MNALWLPLTLLSYLMQAVVGTIDRIIVHKEVTKPVVISFWVAVFSVPTFAIVLVGYLPFEFAEQFRFQIPNGEILARAIMGGFLVQMGLYFMYKALHDWEATRVLSIMGAVTPIVTAIMSYIFLGERLGPLALVAIMILIVGTIALTAGGTRVKSSFTSHRLAYAVAAGATLAVQSVVIKTVYDEFQFISAYALTAIGALMYVGVLVMLSPEVRRLVSGLERQTTAHKKPKKSGKSQVLAIFLNSMMGGLAVIILNLAIFLGTPTGVNALRGVQYAGIFIIAIFLARTQPHLLDEELTRRSIAQKISGILLITIGVALIAVSS